MTISQLPPAGLRRVMPILTDNEWAWIEFIRLCSAEPDPVPTLMRVQTLRLLLEAELEVEQSG